MDRRTWLGLSVGAVGAFGAGLGAGAAQDPKKRETLAKSRAANLERLNEYVLNGRFPQNIQDNKLIPIFYDFNNDVACAVGHLMLKDGKKELVQKIAKENNQVRISDLKEGPVLDWIASSGLTQEECALIQPSYDFERKPAANAVALIQMHLEHVHVFLSTPAQTDHSLDLALLRGRTRAKEDGGR